MAFVGRAREIRNIGNAEMAGRIVIDTERCKACGLCIEVCPKKDIVVSEESNRSGYFPAKAKNENCTACSRCAIVCPEGIIEIFRNDTDKVRIVAAAGKKTVERLIEEKM